MIINIVNHYIDFFLNDSFIDFLFLSVSNA